jgi:magnesium transporter
MSRDEAQSMLLTHPANRQSETQQDAKATWFDLVDPTDEERAKAERATQFKLPTREQLSEVESSSRVNVDNGVLYLSMPLATPGEEGEQIVSPLGFILSPDALVTIRYARLQSFDQVAERLRKEGDAPNSIEVFTRLVEAMIDFGADLLEQLGSELDHISRSIFRKGRRRRRVRPTNLRLRNTLVDVGDKGERLSQIRDTLHGLQRIVLFTSERAADWTQPDLRGRLKTARDDLASLADYEMHLYGKVQFLLDAVLGFINTEQNDIFRVLTIVSVVGIPPTLIASMYGMNFKNMPELSWEWGYQWGLALIVLSIILPILWFKWRNWW